jgi:hypothetical protein
MLQLVNEGLNCVQTLQLQNFFVVDVPQHQFLMLLETYFIQLQRCLLTCADTHTILMPCLKYQPKINTPKLQQQKNLPELQVNHTLGW